MAPREFLGTSLRGKVVGIVGLGRVGSASAKLFRATGCEVIYWSRRRKPEAEHCLGTRYVGLKELLKSSDVVVVSAALTRETKGLIGEAELSLVKEGSILVNVSRGGVIDEDSLVEALASGRLGGAGLDVFIEEPLPRDHPLTRLRNVVLTPHIAGYTVESVVNTGLEVARAIASFFKRGEAPYTALNPEACLKAPGSERLP